MKPILLFIFAMLILLGVFIPLIIVGDSIFADFRSANITGEGVDVFLPDKYPQTGKPLNLLVIPRGGSKTGTYRAMAIINNIPVVIKEGDGITWGNYISSKSRGSSEVQLEIPEIYLKGKNRISFELHVHYVCAVPVRSESRIFENVDYFQNLQISIPLYSYDEKIMKQMTDTGLTILWLLIWVALWFFIVRTIERSSGRIIGMEKLWRFLLATLYAIGSVIGYWIFARGIGSIYGIYDTWFSMAGVIIWIIAPYLICKDKLIQVVDSWT
jgi:hypothetical protein